MFLRTNSSGFFLEVASYNKTSTCNCIAIPLLILFLVVSCVVFLLMAGVVLVSESDVVDRGASIVQDKSY